MSFALWYDGNRKYERRFFIIYDVYPTSVSHFGGSLFVAAVVCLVLSIFLIGATWQLFKKAGKPGWACLVPFYGNYCQFAIAFGNGWLFLLMLVSFVNFVVAIILNLKLAKAFGKGTGFGIGLILARAQASESASSSCLSCSCPSWDMGAQNMPGPSRTFAQVLDDARKNVHREMEVQRVHNEAKKDGRHAYRNVDVKGPNPWRDRTWRDM